MVSATRAGQRLQSLADRLARLDAKIRQSPGQLSLISQAGGTPCGQSWIAQGLTCRKGSSAGQIEGPASSAEASIGRPAAKPTPVQSTSPTPGPPPAEARRGRPRETIAFPNPITGPTGAKLIAYTWQWTLEEKPDGKGEIKEKRVSDWEKSLANVETGRNVVHQFEIENGGQRQVVSAESALKLLGFTSDTDRKRFGSLKSTARTVARLRLAQHELDQLEARWKADWDKVNSIPKPSIQKGPWEAQPWGRERKWTMGDASDRQIDNSNGTTTDQEMTAHVEVSWKRLRMKERGWGYNGQTPTSMQSHLRFSRQDLDRRLVRAEAKLQASRQDGMVDALPEKTAGKEDDTIDWTNVATEVAIMQRLNPNSSNAVKASTENLS